MTLNLLYNNMKVRELSTPSKWKKYIYCICITQRYLQIFKLLEVHKTY